MHYYGGLEKEKKMLCIEWNNVVLHVHFSYLETVSSGMVNEKPATFDERM